MSRISEKIEVESVGVGGAMGRNRNMEHNSIEGVEKRHDKIQLHQSRREDGTHQNDEEEGKQLLLVEDAPIQVQIISAARQSPLCEGKVGKKKELSHEEQDDDDDDVFHQNPYYHPNYYEKNGRWATVPYAFLTLILALLNLFWSVGLSYWNFQLNNFDIAVASLVIIILSGSITTAAFFCTKIEPSRNGRRDLWKCSKVAWLFAAIPTLVPVVLGTVYFISSVLDNGSQLTNESSSSSSNSPGRNERRQCAKSNGATASILSSSTSPPEQLPLIFLVEKWRASSVSFFLIESLSLCFPMCVLHLCVLLENPNSIPSFIGFYTLLGLFLFTFSITFSRFQFDSTHKRDRFGERTEKYLRFCYLCSAKIIWLVTFAILIVTARVLYPGWRVEATLCAIGGLAAVHEIPLWICLIPQCGRLATKVSSLFFLIPQFTSLISLIFWVNTDATVYHTNIGSIVLGVYFWSEAVLLCGWLADGNAEKDIDLVPLYPHFLGDFISSCFIDQQSALLY